MNAEIINPFISSFMSVFPNFGFNDIKRKGISLIAPKQNNDNVLILLGVIGDYRGNVIYRISENDAKKVASKMMMGIPIEELDDMSKSALSELSNMLTANASTFLHDENIKIDITVPTFIQGSIKEIQTDSIKEGICVTFAVDDVEINLELSLKKTP